MNRGLLRGIRIVAVLLIFGLAGFYTGEYLRSSAPPPEPPGTGQKPLVSTIPDFSLSGLDGAARPIANWRGTPMLINFWATWCAPCLREMPLLQALQDERGERLQVIGIAVDRLGDVQAFITEAGITYPILVGQQDAMDAAELFGPDFVALPFSIFVAANGEVLGLRPGELDPEELRELLAILDAVGAGTLAVDAAREQIGGG